jgi:hypothetical protein
MSIESDKIDEKLAMLRRMIAPGIESFSLGLIDDAIRFLEAEKFVLLRDKPLATGSLDNKRLAVSRV